MPIVNLESLPQFVHMSDEQKKILNGNLRTLSQSQTSSQNASSRKLKQRKHKKDKVVEHPAGVRHHADTVRWTYLHALYNDKTPSRIERIVAAEKATDKSDSTQLSINDSGERTKSQDLNTISLAGENEHIANKIPDCEKLSGNQFPENLENDYVDNVVPDCEKLSGNQHPETREPEIVVSGNIRHTDQSIQHYPINDSKNRANAVRISVASYVGEGSMTDCFGSTTESKKDFEPLSGNSKSQYNKSDATQDYNSHSNESSNQSLSETVESLSSVLSSRSSNSTNSKSSTSNFFQQSSENSTGSSFLSESLSQSTLKTNSESLVKSTNEQDNGSISEEVELDHKEFSKQLECGSDAAIMISKLESLFAYSKHLKKQVAHWKSEHAREVEGRVALRRIQRQNAELKQQLNQAQATEKSMLSELSSLRIQRDRLHTEVNSWQSKHDKYVIENLIPDHLQFDRREEENRNLKENVLKLREEKKQLEEHLESTKFELKESLGRLNDSNEIIQLAGNKISRSILSRAMANGNRVAANLLAQMSTVRRLRGTQFSRSTLLRSNSLASTNSRLSTASKTSKRSGATLAP